MSPIPQDKPDLSLDSGIRFFAEHTLSPLKQNSDHSGNKGLIDFCKRLNNIEREFLLNALNPFQEQNPENNPITEQLSLKLKNPNLKKLSLIDSTKNKMNHIWNRISGKKLITSEKLAEQLLVWAERHKPEEKEVYSAVQDFSKSISQKPPIKIEELDDINELKRIIKYFKQSSHSETVEGKLKMASNEDELLEKISKAIPNLEKANQEGREVDGIDNLTNEIASLKNIRKELLNFQSHRISPQQDIINRKGKIEKNIGKLGELRQTYQITEKKKQIANEIDKTLQDADDILKLANDKKISMSDQEKTNLESIIQSLNENKQKVTKPEAKRFNN